MKIYNSGYPNKSHVTRICRRHLDFCNVFAVLVKGIYISSICSQFCPKSIPCSSEQSAQDNFRTLSLEPPTHLDYTQCKQGDPFIKFKKSFTFNILVTIFQCPKLDHLTCRMETSIKVQTFTCSPLVLKTEHWLFTKTHRSRSYRNIIAGIN